MKHIIWLSCIILGVTSCSQNSSQDTVTKTVKTTHAIKYNEEKVLQFPGRIVASEDINLSFRVNGQIDKILVREGEFVNKNKQIAQLINTDYKLQLDATEAEYNQLKGDAERIMALYNDSATTKSVYDKARYGLEQITAKLNHHKELLEYTKLYAPFDGYIQKIHFYQNEVIGAGMPVITILGTKSYEVEINLPTTDYINRDKFTTFSCRTTLLDNKEIKLIPLSTIHKANANQLYTMRLGFAEDIPELSPGMTVCVTITEKNVTTDKTKLIVPNSAVRNNNGETIVFKVDSTTHKATKCVVEMVSIKSDGMSIIYSDDLKSGDMIISAGVNHIDENDIVKPIATITETNVGGLL